MSCNTNLSQLPIVKKKGIGIEFIYMSGALIALHVDCCCEKPPCCSNKIKIIVEPYDFSPLSCSLAKARSLQQQKSTLIIHEENTNKITIL